MVAIFELLHLYRKLLLKKLEDIVSWTQHSNMKLGWWVNFRNQKMIDFIEKCVRQGVRRLCTVKPKLDFRLHYEPRRLKRFLWCRDLGALYG